MNGKLASLFYAAVGGALVASALVLGGCVAQAIDDEQVDETEAALSDGTDPAGHGGLQGVVDPNHGVVLESPMGSGPSDPGDNLPCAGEPEPNPWQPPGAGQPKQGGSSSPNEQPPDPQQQQQQGQPSQMKH